MADLYGLNDYGGLSSSQADVARTIQRTFDASLSSRARALERFNQQTSGPMLQQYGGDLALQRAKSTVGILNQQQQLHDVIDASHHTPHGIMENLSAYAPLAGGLARLYPALFGTGAGSDLTRQGIIPSAYKGLQNLYKYVDQRTGQSYQMDANGNVVYGGGLQGAANQGGWPGEMQTDWWNGGAPYGDWGGGYPQGVPEFQWDGAQVDPAQWADYDPNQFNFFGA